MQKDIENILLPQDHAECIEMLKRSQQVAWDAFFSLEERRKWEQKTMQRQIDALIRLCEQYKENDGEKMTDTPVEPEIGRDEINIYPPWVVSREVARQLYLAGFEKPFPDAGQIWYNVSGRQRVIPYSAIPKEYLEEIKRDYFFAPTAEDIIVKFYEKFGANLSLSFNGATGIWRCDDRAESIILSGCIYWSDRNPANAVAACFLKASNSLKK